ncbi:PspA/IM30 family protein [Alicyclobacillaceae bacterium I2511]|nr:PspA/IM30 family protein [Alicyclobacillaceae bacterium I2511]
MGLFKRAADIMEARVNKFLNSVEDPNEMLDLSYEKMLTGLQEVKRHLADVVTEQKHLENEIGQVQKDVQQYEDAARAALRSGREDLAKEALTRKQTALDHIVQMQEGLTRITEQVEKLKQTEKRFQDRINTFKTQKEVTKATYQAAQAQVKVSESMTGINKQLSGVGDTLKRAQDKTDETVARASAMDALMDEGVLDDTLDSRDNVTRELDQIRKSSAADEELEKLKKEMASTGGQN